MKVHIRRCFQVIPVKEYAGEKKMNKSLIKSNFKKHLRDLGNTT